jgi:hypothetical protein
MLIYVDASAGVQHPVMDSPDVGANPGKKAMPACRVAD